MTISPILLKDGYKVGHKFQYPEGRRAGRTENRIQGWQIDSRLDFGGDKGQAEKASVKIRIK
jgi:hypothetical protein